MFPERVQMDYEIDASSWVIQKKISSSLEMNRIMPVTLAGLIFFVTYAIF